MGANDVHGAHLHNDAASAADLKFLQQLPHARVRNVKSKSGPRNIELLVPLCFRSSHQNEPQGFANFGNGALECYKPSVNESETITEAQPLCWFAAEATANELEACGFRVPAAPHIERS